MASKTKKAQLDVQAQLEQVENQFQTLQILDRKSVV